MNEQERLARRAMQACSAMPKTQLATLIPLRELIQFVQALDAISAAPTATQHGPQPAIDALMNPDYLHELANLIDPDQLWRLGWQEQKDLPANKRKQLDAGVALRRYADHVEQLREVLQCKRSLLVTPLTENSCAIMPFDTPPRHERLRATHEALGGAKTSLFSQAERAAARQASAALGHPSQFAGPTGAAVPDGLAGAIAYQLTKQLVIDMPTARAAVDAAIADAGVNPSFNDQPKEN